MPNNIKKYILISQEKTFYNIISVYKSFKEDKNFELTTNELKTIITKYEYNSLLDSYIIKNLKNDVSHKEMIEFIKENEFELSTEILDELSISKTKYGFSKYYENLFKIKKYYILLIYSQAINDNKFKLDRSLVADSLYKESIIKIYKTMPKNYKKYELTPGFRNTIIREMDFNTMSFSKDNFWKIDILIPSLNSYNDCLKIFERLKNENQIINYATHYKNSELEDKKILIYLQMYTEEMSPQIKGSITRAINAKDKANEKTEV